MEKEDGVPAKLFTQMKTAEDFHNPPSVSRMLPGLGRYLSDRSRWRISAVRSCKKGE
jgi:hypothetical protein